MFTHPFILHSVDFVQGDAFCNLGTLYEGTTATSGIHPECTEREGTYREEFGTMANGARRPHDGGGKLQSWVHRSIGPSVYPCIGPTVVQKPNESGRDYILASTFVKVLRRH